MHARIQHGTLCRMVSFKCMPGYAAAVWVGMRTHLTRSHLHTPWLPSWSSTTLFLACPKKRKWFDSSVFQPVDVNWKLKSRLVWKSLEDRQSSAKTGNSLETSLYVITIMLWCGAYMCMISTDSYSWEGVMYDWDRSLVKIAINRYLLDIQIQISRSI